eukprot:g9408.t1
MMWSSLFVPWRGAKEDHIVKVSGIGGVMSDIRPPLIPPWWCILPPPVRVLRGLYWQGYLDALLWFRAPPRQLEGWCGRRDVRERAPAAASSQASSQAASQAAAQAPAAARRNARRNTASSAQRKWQVAKALLKQSPPKLAKALAVCDPSGETVRTLLKDFYDARRLGIVFFPEHRKDIAILTKYYRMELHHALVSFVLLCPAAAAGCYHATDPQHRPRAHAGGFTIVEATKRFGYRCMQLVAAFSGGSFFTTCLPRSQARLRRAGRAKIQVDDQFWVHVVLCLEDILEARHRHAPPYCSAQGRPYYVDEDPQVEPTRGELEETCFTTEHPTRSKIRRLPRENIHTDAWRENLFPPGTPDDCTVGLPEKCMRLSELFGEDCDVFVESKEGELDDPVDASDIVQGSIGDCFLIGAISGIAAHGAKVLHFWDKEDVIDDLVPMSPEDSETPLFANCKVGDMELWPMVLEKAYAKLHHNWDAIDGGFSGHAVKDMTGGVMQMLDLHGDDKGYSWKAFLRHAQDSLSVMGCACGDHVEEEEGEGQCGEAKGVNGLIKGHAYTVLSAYGDDGVRIVQVRNPWGNEAEWTGDWSDQSALWEKHPEVAEAVAFEPKEDGTCPGLFLGGCGQTSVGGFWVSMFGKTSSYTQSAIHK